MARSLLAFAFLAGLVCICCTQASTRHLSQAVVSSSSTSSGASGELISTSSQQSDLWNVSGLVIQCGGERIRANAWDGTTRLEHWHNSTADTLKVGFEMSVSFPGVGVFRGSPEYAWLWTSQQYQAALAAANAGAIYWSPPSGVLVQLKDAGADNVRLGVTFKADLTDWNLLSVTVSGVKSNTCKGACFGSACTAAECNDSGCSPPKTASGSTSG